MPRLSALLLLAGVFCLGAPSLHPQNPTQHLGTATLSDEDRHSLLLDSQIHNPTLWHDPGDIATRNLFYGQGGEKGQPLPPFTFLGEDLRQSTPKFDTRDSRDRKWRGKLGHEARPEVVASRLLWAVGYYVNDDYLLPSAEIPGLVMKRGKKLHDGPHLTNVRFARKPSGQKKIGLWSWSHNPFTGTRELNGLRVMIALINSWDLKDENNSIYSDEKNDRQLFLVSDIGTSFGRNGLHFNNGASKDNVEAYVHSDFITATTPTTVSFGTPAPSPSLLLETLGVGTHWYRERNSFLWIGREIPRADAKWIGTLLGQLSHQQLVDAFRAGNYPPGQVTLFVTAVERRIHALQAL